MKVFPNCKINLGLSVVERRPDGYHNLETLFLPVPLCDELTLEPAEKFSFEQNGILLDNSPLDNLVVKAHHLLSERYPQVEKVSISLKKNIPFGAGLGGGSSDAAFTLTALNALFGLGCSFDELEGYAAKIGADCAFFVQNRAAYATGIGDILEPVDFDLSDYHFVLLKPSDHVSTKEAYSGIKPTPSKVDLREAVKQPIEKWKDLIVNDFELSVFPNHPRIEFLKNHLYEKGALYASMTGSGAAVFGLFEKGKVVDQSSVQEEEIILR